MSAHRPQIDPRGQQFAASLTVVVLAAVLATAPSTLAWLLLAAQGTFFAVGAVAGPQYTPQALLFKRFVRPRLGAPTELEDAAPPRFAQAVGLAFAGVGLLGVATGITTLALGATALALTAALLNAAFGFCLGCEMYLLGKRLVVRGPRAVDVRQAA